MPSRYLETPEGRVGRPARRSFDIHIGAHKTATTHFQNLMEGQVQRFREQGVAYIPRERGREHLGTFFRRRQWRHLVGGTIVLRYIDACYADVIGGAPRIAISDENIIGGARDAIETGFYPMMERNVRFFSAMRSAADVRFHISIRSLERFFPSVYLEALRWGPVDPEAIPRLKASILSEPPTWRSFVMRLRRAARGCPIILWRYEDYAENWRSVMGQYLGLDCAELSDIPRPAETVSPSFAVAAKIATLDPKMSLFRWHQKASAIIAEDTSPRVDPTAEMFSEAETASLQREYARDLDSIARMEGVSFLRF